MRRYGDTTPGYELTARTGMVLDRGKLENITWMHDLYDHPHEAWEDKEKILRFEACGIFDIDGKLVPRVFRRKVMCPVTGIYAVANMPTTPIRFVG